MRPPGPPPGPPPDFARRKLRIDILRSGLTLRRIHRSHLGPLHFGRPADPAQRRRWDSPDATYGVCYLAEEGHTAFAETLLRDLTLDVVAEAELRVRSLAGVRIRSPLRLVAMHSEALRPHGADASVVHGPYPVTCAWSAAIHAHPSRPDGIRYRARHDDSGMSIALFERAQDRVEHAGSDELMGGAVVQELAHWLDRYGVGLTG